MSGDPPGFATDEDPQVEFLASLRHKRILEVLRLTGAYQASSPQSKSVARRVLRVVRRACSLRFLSHPGFQADPRLGDRLPVRLVRPSELLAELCMSPQQGRIDEP
jgi:hypothetical protein